MLIRMAFWVYGVMIVMNKRVFTFQLWYNDILVKMIEMGKVVVK